MQHRMSARDFENDFVQWVMSESTNKLHIQDTVHMHYQGLAILIPSSLGQPTA